MIYNQLPPLNALKAFDAVVKDGSISEAAFTLCVSQSSVSRHIANLESFFGVKLLYRGKQGVQTTPQGQMLYDTISSALTDIINVSSSIKATHLGVRVVKVSSLSSLALRWLIPNIEDFQTQYPDIILDITISDHKPDFELGEVDCAIISETQTQSKNTPALFKEELIIVGTQTMLNEKPVKHRHSILKHKLIHTSSRPELWPLWCKNNDLMNNRDIQGGLVFQDFYMSIAACLAGRGLMLVPQFLVKEELATGKLVSPFTEKLATGREYKLAIAPIKQQDRATLAFKNWLLTKVEQTIAPHNEG